MLALGIQYVGSRPYIIVHEVKLSKKGPMWDEFVIKNTGVTAAKGLSITICNPFLENDKGGAIGVYELTEEGRPRAATFDEIDESRTAARKVVLLEGIKVNPEQPYSFTLETWFRLFPWFLKNASLKKGLIEVKFNYTDFSNLFDYDETASLIFDRERNNQPKWEQVGPLAKKAFVEKFAAEHPMEKESKGN